jgi:hypothetical protein
MAASALVADVAATLEPTGIAVMPIKGALLQHWLYDDPADRPLTDVDLLISEADFPDARRALLAAGYRCTNHSNVGGAVFETRFGLMLDLHCRLFGPARYSLPTAALFARSVADGDLFGVPVRLPSPLDAYAHLVGKAGSDHIHAYARERLREIQRLGHWLDLPADTIAEHLVGCGMRRVARYVLALVARNTNDPLSLRIVDALPADPLGGALARLADAILARVPADSTLGAVVAHSLNDRLLRGARSGVAALVLRRPR